MTWLKNPPRGKYRKLEYDDGREPEYESLENDGDTGSIEDLDEEMLKRIGRKKQE